MYAVQSTSTLRRAREAVTSGRLREHVSGTVLLLGTTSLLTDISSESVSAILPLYLVATLGFSPLQYGVIDGIYQGSSALVRLIAGYLGDRLSRHKLVASFGYGLSAFCKLALALVSGAWGGLSTVILLDRTGKGLRTAPRDAMISMSAPKRNLGLAFGIHRSMDTAGAMLGPLLAFVLLAATTNGFHSLFLVSFFIAIQGLLVLTLLVREPARREAATEKAEKPDLRAAFQLLSRPQLRGLMLAGSALGLATVSDGFIYITLHQEVKFENQYFPLLATGTAVLFMVLAAPLGRLADRIGRGKILVAGYVLLLAAYCVLMLPPAGAVTIVAVLALLGTYYAATDGVLMAMGSAHVPEALRGSGLALLGTATSITQLLASVIFGALCTVTSIQTAIAVFACGLVIAMVLAVHALRLARA
jgi:MFS family permease